MSEPALVLLILIAIAIGWLLGRWELSKKKQQQSQRSLSNEYFKGLNFLLNEQPDKAIDVFVRALDVNSDTVETHLALGSLYRKRGEVDRAIKIHQNLLARPSLDRTQQGQVQLALAQDFLAAGLLDRAERLLRDIEEQGGEHRNQAIRYLLKIFEQEKEWRSAIEMGEKLLKAGSDSVLKSLAHYRCELAAKAIAVSDLNEARQHLRHALQYDKNCVRASLMQGSLEFQAGRYKDAIKALKRIKIQDADFLPESVKALQKCYNELGQEQELIRYLKLCMEDNPSISIALILAEIQTRTEGEQASVTTIANYLKRHPSVKGLNRLIAMQIERSEGEAKENLAMLQQLTKELMQRKPAYFCESCGFSGHSLHWMCPSCKTWGTIKPFPGLEGE